ncbi:MAG: ABC transporter permease, partial [Pseudomonadota bacterium]
MPRWLALTGAAFLALTALFLLAPLAVVVTVSFSESQFIAFPPDGYSLRWYGEALSSDTYLAAAWLSLRIAVLVTLSSCLIGGLAAVAIHRGTLP